MIYQTFHHTWKAWQHEAYRIITGPLDLRKVFWFYDDEKGKSGKTCVGKYAVIQDKACFMGYGACSDLLHIANKRRASLYIWNLSKSKPTGKFGISDMYSAIEYIKDGVACITKYDGDCGVWPIPQIAVFSNYPPAQERMASDRFHVYYIDRSMDRLLKVC